MEASSSQFGCVPNSVPARPPADKRRRRGKTTEAGTRRLGVAASKHSVNVPPVLLNPFHASKVVFLTFRGQLKTFLFNISFPDK